VLLKVKNVNERTNSITDINSFMGIFVFCCIKVHLLLIDALNIARSSSMLVKSQTEMSDSRTSVSESKLYNSKLFAM